MDETSSGSEQEGSREHMVLANYRAAIRTGRTIRWEEVSTYPAGERIGEVAVTPLFDAAGIATGLIGIVHDITERKRAEKALREDRHARQVIVPPASLEVPIVAAPRP